MENYKFKYYFYYCYCEHYVLLLVLYFYLSNHLLEVTFKIRIAFTSAVPASSKPLLLTVNTHKVKETSLLHQ